MLKNRKGVILGVKNFLKNSITPTITPHFSEHGKHGDLSKTH